MNRKILLSLGLIVFVSALSYGATGAFFSDSETSTGNTFTAGAIDLTVDSQSHYNGATCTDMGVQAEPRYQWQGGSGYPVAGTACDGTWAQTNLGPGFKFFNFGDVKPGDNGEDTVSLHIDNNPAWACAYIKTTANDENTYTQPEINAGDVSAGDVNGKTNGELAQNVYFFTWSDTASSTSQVPGVPGDNIWQAGEPITTQPTALSGLLNATTTLTLADSTTGTPLAGGSTSYVGMAWCAGTLDVSTPGVIKCDGSTMDNKSQTDSATADVTFYVEQSRNNANFRCVPLPQVVN